MGADWDKRRSQWRRRLRTRRSPKPKLFRKPRSCTTGWEPWRSACQAQGVSLELLLESLRDVGSCSSGLFSVLAITFQAAAS